MKKNNSIPEAYSQAYLQEIVTQRLGVLEVLEVFRHLFTPTYMNRRVGRGNRAAHLSAHPIRLDSLMAGYQIDEQSLFLYYP